MEKFYLRELDKLKVLADSMPNTPMLAHAKIDCLVLLNMRYEPVISNRQLERHPYLIVAELVQDSQIMLRAWREVGFIEDSSTTPLQAQSKSMEEAHHDLFQDLWVNFDPEGYTERIERYVYRLKINKLGDGWLTGMKCVDVGCGHGNFAHALLQQGAAFVCGIDYGEKSIDYAVAARAHLGITADQIQFEVGSAYELPYQDASFDFGVQNGVFHHLEDEDAAIRELHRVLKPGAWMWYYTDGAGGISHDLWDASATILRDVPHEIVVEHLTRLNLNTGKRYHLGDGLNAVYRHASWQELTERLARSGFGNFRRLVGGFPTDMDHDVIASDVYGREKFGEGDLRVLAQKTGTVSARGLAAGRN